MSEAELSPQSIAAKRLYDLANELNDLRGAIDVREYEPHNPIFGLAREAVRAVAGQPIVGNTSYANYYSSRVPVYERNSLSHHQFVGNDFKGIIRRLVNIDIPKVGGTGKRFCLQVAPLSSVVGPEWSDFYLARGQEAQLHHPFADPDKAGKSVWIPLDSMGERAIFFPVDPKASTDKPRRMPVW